MEFDKSRVYTALNADKLKIGSKVIFAPTIGDLKQFVKSYCDALSNTVDGIMPEYFPDRFLSNDNCYNLAYLISEPEEKKLKWTDLKIGDIIQHGDKAAMITVIDSNIATSSHIYAYGWVSDEELESYEKVE